MSLKAKCFWFIIQSCGFNYMISKASASVILLFMKPADWIGYLFFAVLYGAISFLLFSNAYSLFKDMVRAVVAENEGE